VSKRVPVYREVADKIDARTTPTLDVGCGNNKIPGAVGIDIVSGTQADIVHDLNQIPWPLESNMFEFIRLWSVLEHLRDVVGVLREVHRVARPGATVIIGTPHFSSVSAYRDPTHLHFFSAAFLDYFLEDSELGRRFGFYSDIRFRLDERRVTLSPFWGLLRLTPIVNRTLSVYETYLCSLVRGADIQVKLTVLKESS